MKERNIRAIGLQKKQKGRRINNGKHDERREGAEFWSELTAEICIGAAETRWLTVSPMILFPKYIKRLRVEWRGIESVLGGRGRIRPIRGECSPPRALPEGCNCLNTAPLATPPASACNWANTAGNTRYSIQIQLLKTNLQLLKQIQLNRLCVS